MKRPRYQPIPEWDREQALSELCSGDAERARLALLSLAFYDHDPEWVERLCLEQARSANEAIRGTAFLCFGHLARLHGLVDVDRVVAAVEAGLRDVSPGVRGQAQSARDDIEFFTRRRGEG